MEKIKQILFEKLIKRNAFWSYADVREIDDELLVEKVMLILDIDDINDLFSVFDKGFIRRVWKKKGS